MRFYYIFFLLFFCLRIEAQDPNLKEVKINNYSILNVGDLEKFILDKKDNLCGCWLRETSVTCTCMPTHKLFLLMMFTTLPPMIAAGTWLCTQNCVTAADQCQKSCDHIRYDNVWRACMNGCPDTKEWINPSRCNTGIGLLTSVAPAALILKCVANACSWSIEKLTGTRNQKILALIKEKYFHCRAENDPVDDEDIFRWGSELMKERSDLLKKFTKNQALILCQSDFPLLQKLIDEGYFLDVKPLVQALAKLASLESIELLNELNCNEISGHPIDTKIWETLVHIIPRKNTNAEVKAKLLSILKSSRKDIDNNNEFDSKIFFDQVIKYGSVDKALKFSFDKEKKNKAQIE